MNVPKQYVWISFSLIALTTVWMACSKHNTSSENNSRMTLMTQAVWKYDTSGIDLNKDGKIDLADTLEQCFKDNTYQFKTDSTVLVNEGPTKCNSTDPQTATYAWSISSGTPAILKSDANAILAGGLTVLTLSSTQLTVYKDTTIAGIGIWFILSMKH